MYRQAYKQTDTQRRGAIIPLAAILTVVIFGMVAFAVDIGWMAVSQSELQNAADSAALAGANPLMNGYVQYTLAPTSNAKATVLSAAMASAKANAIKYAGYNAAGGVSSLTLNSSDIEFGYTDATNKYTAYSNSSSPFPNTIKVAMRRDSTANQPLALFFGRILGTSTTNLYATASATIYTGTINSLAQSTINSGLLPVTYDVNHWNNFLSTGQGPDGTSTTDGNGVPELQIYPSVNFPGNFGQLSLNDTHVGNSTEVGWVNSGVSSSDIQNLVSNNLLPLSKNLSNSNPWDWQGDTGMKASLIMAINAQAGNTYILPLYTPVNSTQANYQAAQGQGANTFYNIVQLVGVQIMVSPSDNKQVIVQPAAVVDANAIFTSGTVVPAGAGSSSGLVTTFTTPKLSR